MLMYVLELTDITKNKTWNMIGTKILIPIVLGVIFIICMQLFYNNKNKYNSKEEVNRKLIVKIFKDRTIDIANLNLEKVILSFSYINNEIIDKKIEEIEKSNLIIKENNALLELTEKNNKKEIIKLKRIIRKEATNKNKLAKEILQIIKNDTIIFNEFMALVNKNISDNISE